MIYVFVLLFVFVFCDNCRFVFNEIKNLNSVINEGF